MTSFLQTDGYKFSMAQAGLPLQEETFYLSFRKGGWQYISFDLEAEIRKMLPNQLVNATEQAFLQEHGYDTTAAMRHALALMDTIKISAVPVGSWVYEREPIVTITGPSFVVSWLEPLMLRLFFPIQLATCLQRRTLEKFDPSCLLCTTEEQANIARRMLGIGVSHDRRYLDAYSEDVKVDSGRYLEGVAHRARTLLDIVHDPSRIFEVGMRSVTCESQHEICLEVLRELGIRATSNVHLAQKFDMIPVGTMGHEHVQRWGSDLLAYRTMTGLRQERPSFLLDTFDTITKGIPAAIRIMQDTKREAAIRYDSGDKFGQYIYAHGEFARQGLQPTHVLEDSLDDQATMKFERLREHTELAPEKQIYGYGGYLVHGDWPNPLTRDRVSAVYKLSMTGGEPRMKFGNEAGLGKVSIPGRPTTWRRLRGHGPLSIIGQLGEPVAEDYIALAENRDAMTQLMVCNSYTYAQIPSNPCPYILSHETQRLIRALTPVPV